MASRFYALVFVAMTGILGMVSPPDLALMTVQAKTTQDRKAEADRLIESGYQLYDTSKYQEALQLWEKALTIYQEIKDLKGKGTALNAFGNANYSFGKYQTAIEYYQQALEIRKEIKDRKGEGSSLRNLGLAYSSLDKYDKAIEFYLQSLEIAREIKDHLGEGLSLGNLGIAYLSLGKYDKAIEFQLQRLAIAREIKDRQGEGSALGNLGLAYDYLGKYDKAINYHQQSLAIDREIKDRQGEGASLGNLGIAYNSLGKYDKAIEFHLQSLAIAREIKNRSGEGRSLGNLGGVYQALGKYDKAIKFQLQSLAITREIKYRSGEMYGLNSLGYAYRSLNRDQEAMISFQLALTIAREIGDRRIEGYALADLGNVLSRAKQPELAILFYKQSINVRETIRQDIRKLDQDIQKSYLATVESTYRNLADLLLKQDRILEAQQVLDLLKVQELSDYLKTVRGNSQTSQGVDLQRPEQNIIALASELNQLQQKDREGNLNQTEAQRLAQLVRAERDQNKQFNSFLDSPEIKKLITELRRVEDNQNVDVAKYRKLQKDLLSQFPKAVLLYPLILEDRLELVILNANTPPLRRTVNIKREDLNEAIITLLIELRDKTLSPEVKENSQKLYNVLIKPFEAELAQLNIDTIIYAPDGQLRYIPLASLHDGKQWLVEKYRINNITAESLTAFNSKPITNPRIFAGAFGGKGGEIRAGFSGLPATINEVQKIASQFPNTTKLIEKEFTKSITEDRANSYTILHLATHGKLAVGTPEDSFILFGNGEKVTISELKDWNLSNIDLVVLSACQTALGSKLGTGIEVLGLGYQMQAAGARVAIASLWEVSDDGTQALMDAFYAELKKGNVTVTEALRRAQVTMIKSGKYNHPFYWSAFFAIGNGL
jgi:CHAT domain-containing protein/tetratricopeptide (TPR) repeat protein